MSTLLENLAISPGISIIDDDTNRQNITYLVCRTVQKGGGITDRLLAARIPSHSTELDLDDHTTIIATS